MIIELGYWDKFWIGFVVGFVLVWILYWCVIKIINICINNDVTNHSKPNYLNPTKFEYKTPDYFKHVPVKEMRLHNQEGFPKSNRVPPKTKHNPHK